MAIKLLPVTITDYINARLDAGYNKTAGKVLKQVDQMIKRSMEQIITDLDSEAKRLDDLGQTFTPDNPVLTDAQRRLTELLIAVQMLILANDQYIELTAYEVAAQAVSSKVFATIATEIITAGKDPIAPAAATQFRELLYAKGIAWNIPDLTYFTDQAAISFIDTAEWITKMQKWGVGYADLTRQTIIDGISNGWNPYEIARVMRIHAINIPGSAADNLMRTLQMTAYREASLAMEQINGKFIQKKIRIAMLDNRTCLTCIALHGTELKPGQRIDDHYRGRCSEYYVTVGGELPAIMQADSTPGNRKFVPFQTGEQWFNSLPLERQRQQMSFLKSPGKWNAFQSGTPLSSFIGEYNDSVFGRQVVENSLVGIFGKDASKYYAVNNP